jgi:hypothetical protein
MKIPIDVWHIRPPKVHWRKFVERKVIMLTCVVVISPYLSEYLHLHLFNHIHELALGTLCEHLVFGVALEEV